MATKNNTVTNEQESFFRAVTKTSVTIEAVDPVSVQTPAPASVQTPAPVSVQTPAPVSVQTPAPVSVQTPAPASVQTPASVEAQRNWIPIVGSILLGLLGVLLVIALGWFLFSKLGSSTPSTTTSDLGSNNSSTNGMNLAPISSGNNEAWKAVLTSANSNGNFIGDFGGRGNGSTIPSEAVDLGGNNWKVGRALLTYCENASTCYYMFATPGKELPRAFNVNLYTPEFAGDLEKELQYVNTGWNNNANVTWTYWNNN